MKKLSDSERYLLREMPRTPAGIILDQLDAEELEKQREAIEKKPVIHVGPDVDPQEHVLFRLGVIQGIKLRREYVNRK